MINNFLANWPFMRILRLAIGLMIGFQAYQAGDKIAGFIAVLFLYQAISNTGCGLGGACVPARKSATKAIDPNEFEEIK